MAGKIATVRDPIRSRKVKERTGVVATEQNPVADPDAITPAEAKRLRQSLKQTREGKTRPWTEIKDELGL